MLKLLKSCIFLYLGLLLTSLSFAGDSISSQQEEVERIKAEILELAYEFVGDVDADGTKQAVIDDKIDELRNYIPNLSMQERAENAVGAWRQVWGPYAFDGSDSVPRGMDVNSIYQVIDADGFYYNFAKYNFGPITTRTFLRGNFEVTSDLIEVEFNQTGIILGERQTPMPLLTDKLERGEVRAIRFPDFLPPVGISGALIEIYADEDIRLNYGVIGEEVESPALFVMESFKE